MEAYQELSKDISIYRGFLTLNEQLEMIQEIPHYFNLFDENGDYNYPDRRGNKKGRCFRKIADCPPSVLKKTKEIKRVMEEKNQVFVYPDFTHVLLNAYPSAIGMDWHQDDTGSHDGDENAPVYTLSLGNDAIFVYRTFPKDVDHIVKLNSGDLLVFGGSLRRMFHCLKEVIVDSFEGCNLRYNLTFRTCSNLTDEQYENAQTEKYNIRRKEECVKSRKERRKQYM
jgi:hypothetical protein